MPACAAPAVATYLRVSTRSQDHASQRLALARYAQAHGLDLAREHVDTASGKTTAKRPALAQLLAACRRGEVSTVLVAKLDRLGRSVRDVCNIAHELEQLGVRLIVADQGGTMDTGTPAGRLLFHVLAAVGEMERALCVERVRSGLAAARARGQRLGRPRLAQAVVDQARTLRSRGVSWRVTAQQLGVSVNAIRRALAAA